MTSNTKAGIIPWEIRLVWPLSKVIMPESPLLLWAQGAMGATVQNGEKIMIKGTQKGEKFNITDLGVGC